MEDEAERTLYTAEEVELAFTKWKQTARIIIIQEFHDTHLKHIRDSILEKLAKL